MENAIVWLMFWVGMTSPVWGLFLALIGLFLATAQRWAVWKPRHMCPKCRHPVFRPWGGVDRDGLLEAVSVDDKNSYPKDDRETRLLCPYCGAVRPAVQFPRILAQYKITQGWVVKTISEAESSN